MKQAICVFIILLAIDILVMCLIPFMREGAMPAMLIASTIIFSVWEGISVTLQQHRERKTWEEIEDAAYWANKQHAERQWR